MSGFRTALRLRRAIPAIVLFALVFAQTLGAMHRIVHAPVPGQIAGIGAGLRSHVPASEAAGQGWLLALFSGHTSEQGCDLYDQLSHADGLPAAALLPDAAPIVSSQVAVAAPVAIRVRALAVRARGPPLLA